MRIWKIPSSQPKHFFVTKGIRVKVYHFLPRYLACFVVVVPQVRSLIIFSTVQEPHWFIQSTYIFIWVIFISAILLFVPGNSYMFVALPLFACLSMHFSNYTIKCALDFIFLYLPDFSALFLRNIYVTVCSSRAALSNRIFCNDGHEKCSKSMLFNIVATNHM